MARAGVRTLAKNGSLARIDARQVERRDMAADMQRFAAGDDGKENHAAQRIAQLPLLSLLPRQGPGQECQIGQPQIDGVFPGIAGQRGIDAAAIAGQKMGGWKGDQRQQVGHEHVVADIIDRR